MSHKLTCYGVCVCLCVRCISEDRQCGRSASPALRSFLGRGHIGIRTVPTYYLYSFLEQLVDVHDIHDDEDRRSFSSTRVVPAAPLHT